MATYFDQRSNTKILPVARASIAQMSWATGAGHTAQTENLSINGIIKMICIRISAVTGDPDITITLADSKTNQIYNSGALNDGTNYVYTAAEFLPTANEIPVTGPVTVSADPDADAGGSAQTLTVDIDIYYV